MTNTVLQEPTVVLVASVAELVVLVVLMALALVALKIFSQASLEVAVRVATQMLHVKETTFSTASILSLKKLSLELRRK